jgi:hypothetical protein
MPQIKTGEMPGTASRFQLARHRSGTAGVRRDRCAGADPPKVVGKRAIERRVEEVIGKRILLSR